MEDTSEDIHSVNFNQDNGCFIVATSNGLRVFNTNEFQSTFFRGKSRQTAKAAILPPGI
jgi:hypothetical protein